MSIPVSTAFSTTILGDLIGLRKMSANPDIINLQGPPSCQYLSNMPTNVRHTSSGSVRTDNDEVAARQVKKVCITYCNHIREQ